MVWGGDFQGNALNIFASNPSVLQITPQPQPRGADPLYRRYKIKALSDTDQVSLFISPDTNPAHAWDTVTFLVHTAAEQSAYYRDRVISIARSFVGSHYLWGAAGASPDQHNGMPGRPGSVSILSLASPDRRDIQHSVAICRVTGFNTCAGKPLPFPGTQEARTNTAAANYAADSAHLNLSLENDTSSYRTVYKEYNPGNRRRLGILLGEKCEGKRHFDCVGFVNYCLSAALGVSTQLDICGTAQYNYRGYANAFHVVSPSEPHQPGDILIFGGTEIEIQGQNGPRRVLDGGHHIGFSLGDGRQMVHAAETEYGVGVGGIGGGVTRRVRHPRLA